MFKISTVAYQTTIVYCTIHNLNVLSNDVVLQFLSLPVHWSCSAMLYDVTNRALRVHKAIRHNSDVTAQDFPVFE
jgi:hypothetical protein